MKSLARVLATVLAGGALASGAVAATPDALADGFAQPPRDARPLVFWQWVNGNVTQEGIRLDLEWMQRIGLAGALIFDIGFRTPPVPQYVRRRVGFGTPPWQQAVRFAAAEARRLGLLLGAQSSGGWSVSGGPSVPPGQAMKKLVWSETHISPGTPDGLRLAPPPSTSGPFQDMPIDHAHYREPRASGDVAVIAFRLPDAEQTPAAQAMLSGIAETATLQDGSHSLAAALVPNDLGVATIDARVEFVPQAVTIGKAGGGALPPGAIEASADGLRFETVVQLPGDTAQASPVTTYWLHDRRAKFWRLRFTGLTAPLALTELRFEAGARLHRFQEKAGYGTLPDTADAAVVWNRADSAIDPERIVDLTAHMGADGTLTWRPGEGRWAVLRFGWSLTGRRVVPATDESLGLEVDKLDAHAVQAFAEEFFARYAQAIGDAGALHLALTDSWEAGQQNWTAAMFDEFARRRGYDLRAWLPAIAGWIVGDAGRSERFLADFRRTISDLLIEHHYDALAQVAHRLGMSYLAEAPGIDQPTVIDGIAARGRVDVPTGEFWFYPPGAPPNPKHVADLREAASAAHIYGRPIVAAEALTSQGEEPWALGPAQLRRMTDRFFAEGVNRLILHTSAHQPFTDRVPGITLRQYGQHFTRHETWADDAAAWVDYLARCSFLLQQGRAVADVAVYLGEDAPLPYADAEISRLLTGFDYDILSAEVLLDRLQVRDGRLVLPSGASYRLLVIPPQVRRMSPPLLRKLRELLRQGALIVGYKPLDAAGLDDQGVAFLAGELWGEGKVMRESALRVGPGRLYWRLEHALRDETLQPDVVIERSRALHWSHRATPDTDIYFVTNQSAAEFADTVRFRVSGRHAQLWNAVDGSHADASYQPGDSHTAVRLRLAPWESVFVVFRGPVRDSGIPVATTESVLATLAGPWTVQFLDGRGAPRKMPLAALASWTDQEQAGVRYYSGRALYSRQVQVNADWLADGQRIELDLGEVRELARVRVNGRDLGLWWNPPLRADITPALHAGANRLEIVVTNYWANRLIGDQQPGARRHTFSSIHPYGADSALRVSGLLGPVRLLGVKASP